MPRASRIDSPYGTQRIVRGIRHILIGKVVASGAGVGTFLLVVRGLPLDQFAAYAVLIGMVEVLLAVTSVGTAQILTR